MKFEYSSQFDCELSELFAYHEASHALDRLLPPRIDSKVIVRPNSLRVGQKACIDFWPIPGIKFQMQAEHVAYDPPKMFADQQVSGPFAKWRHEHRMSVFSEGGSQLTDAVEYKISKLGVISSVLHKRIERELHSTFAYRHRVTAQDIRLKRSLHNEPIRIAVSGSSGMLGRRVLELASSMGMQLVTLKRVSTVQDVEQFHSADSEFKETPWHLQSGTVRPQDWDGIDAVIHLAGANMGGKRWTESYKDTIRTSRIDCTKRLVDYLQKSNVLPRAWITASGAGIYPDSNDTHDESSPPADDFVGTLAHDWEEASRRVEQLGSRWCAARLSMVLDPLHGALAPLLWQWKLCLGGLIGRGDFYWSWIERDDAASALLWLATNPNCSGPYNISGRCVTFRDFANSLSSVLHRPCFLRAPRAIVRTMLGEFADGLLLRSNRVDNQKLLGSGYPIRYLELDEALRHLLL